MKTTTTAMMMAAMLCVAGAASADASSPGRQAIAACSGSVEADVRAMYPQARRVQFLGDGLTNRISDSQISVTGRGQFDSRSGWSRFSYSCVYNVRSGGTYAVNVRGGGSASDGKPHDGNDAAKIAGAVIGVAIAAAISNSTHHKHTPHGGGGASDWFSPASGINCSNAQSACFHANGRFASGWTKKVFVTGEYAN